MSTYGIFYIKTADKFIQVGNFSRNNALYEFISNQLPYGKIKKVDNSNLLEICDTIQTKIDEYADYIKECNYKIALIPSYNNSISEKDAEIYDLKERIAEYQDSIEELIMARSLVILIHNILIYNTETTEIYAGIECYEPTVEDIME